MASLSILYAVYLSKNNMEPTQALLDLDSTSYKMSAILGDSTLVTEAQVDELIKGFQGILNYNESSDDDDDEDEQEEEKKKKVASTSIVEQPLRLDIDFSRVVRRKQPASKKKDDKDDVEDESRYIKKGPIRPKMQQHNHHQAREKPYHDQTTSHNNCQQQQQQQQQQVLDTSDETSSSDFDFGAQAIMTDPICRQQIHDCLDKLTELNQDAASPAPWLSPVDFSASLGDFRQPTTPSSISSSGQSCNGADNSNPSPLAYQRSIEPHLEDELCSSAAMGPRFVDTTTTTNTDNAAVASFNYVNYDLVEEVIRHDLEPRSSNKNTLSSGKSSILDSFLNQNNYAPPYPNHVAPSPTTTTTATTNYISPDSYPTYQNCAMTTTSPEQQQTNDVAGGTLLAATYHSPNHGNHSPPMSILSPASDSAYYNNNNNNANGYCSSSSNLHLSPSNCSSPGSNPGGVVSPNSRSTTLSDHYQWHSTPQLSGAYSYAKMTFSPQSDPQLDGRYLPMLQQPQQPQQQQQQQGQNFSPNSCSNGTSYSVPSLTGTLSPRQDSTDLYYETSAKTSSSSSSSSSGVNPHERETFVASPLDELVQAVRHTLPTLHRQAQELIKRCSSIRSDDSSKAANSSIGPSFDNFPIPTTVTEYTSRYKSAQKDELHFANPWSMLDSREINMCPRLKELIDPQSLAASMLQVQRKSVDELVTPDKDGDTLLLRFMGNSIELRRKLAYVPPLIKRICAMSADHLTVENKRGEDALFLACVRSPHLAFLAPYLATLFARKNPLIGRKFYRITRCSLLHTLAALGDSHIDVMVKLFEVRDENGCQIFHCNILDDNGKTPLHIATEYHERFGPRHSCAKTIRLLLGYGCAPQQLDANKESALHRAVRNTCDPEICELLLKSAAASSASASRTMLRQADVRGNTVLHYVAAAQNPRVQDVSRQEKVCRLLVEAGARLDCKNLRGEAPYDLILAERRDALFRISQKE
uniref:ANK_REP_REGION domain-containing protein n=1 Tax=Trichogramma kaykai TaxID=54128 RepID=A0ABD2WT05_9HYME